jgi:hypothetical protein
VSLLPPEAPSQPQVSSQGHSQCFLPTGPTVPSKSLLAWLPAETSTRIPLSEVLSTTLTALGPRGQGREEMQRCPRCLRGKWGCTLRTNPSGQARSYLYTL